MMQSVFTLNPLLLCLLYCPTQEKPAEAAPAAAAGADGTTAPSSSGDGDAKQQPPKSKAAAEAAAPAAAVAVAAGSTDEAALTTRLNKVSSGSGDRGAVCDAMRG